MLASFFKNSQNQIHKTKIPKYQSFSFNQFKYLMDWNQKEAGEGDTEAAITLYESFTLTAVKYSLCECVYIWREMESREKKVEAAWFFRPVEIAIWSGLRREISLGKAQPDLAPPLGNITSSGNGEAGELEIPTSQGHEKEILAGSSSSSHGTTVLWLRNSPKMILFAVDSRTTTTLKANDPNLLRTNVEVLLSDKEQKFAMIKQGDVVVYATLIGDSTRCWSMVKHVRTELKKESKHPSISYVGELATAYFRNNLRNLDEYKSVVYMCSWISQKQRYFVIKVGDDFDKPTIVYDDLWGGGSGSELILQGLRSTGPPKVEEELVKAMLEASVADPFTGGEINVYSLRDGNFKCVHTTSLVDELYRHNEEYEVKIYTQSMFVIISYRDGEILSPRDLVLHVQRYDPTIRRKNIRWLCMSGDFLVYVVQLASEEYRDKWFNSCDPTSGASIRFEQFENVDRVRCDLHLAHASRLVLDRVKTMRAVDDLF